MNNLSIKKVPKAKTNDFKALTLPLIKVGAFDNRDVHVFLEVIELDSKKYP